jgi:hypothetical protein
VAELDPDRRKAVFEQYCLRIAPLLLRQFFAQLQSRSKMPSTAQNSKKSKTSAPSKVTLVALVVLKALESYVQCACAHFSQEQVGWMAKELVAVLRNAELEGMSAVEVGSGSDAQSHISESIRHLQCLFVSLLLEDDSSMAACVMDIVTALGSVLESSSLDTHLVSEHRSSTAHRHSDRCAGSRGALASQDWTKKACMENGGDVDRNKSLVKVPLRSLPPTAIAYD